MSVPIRVLEPQLTFLLRASIAGAALMTASCSATYEHHFSDRDATTDDAKEPSDGTPGGEPSGDAPRPDTSQDAPPSDAGMDLAGGDVPRLDASDVASDDTSRPDGSSLPDGSLFDAIADTRDSNAPDAPDAPASDTPLDNAAPPNDGSRDIADAGADAPIDAPADTGDGACTDPAACTPDPPRLLAPQSTGFVTKARPTFKWTAAAKATEYRVDICTDAGCSIIEQSLPTTATSAQPSGSFAGKITRYWRVLAINGDFASTSAIWEFTTRITSASVDTSVIGPADFNGDARRDVAIATPGQIHVLMNSGTGLPNSPNQTIDGTSGFGDGISYAGDVNGDGRGDLIVSSRQNGFARLFLGNASGVATSSPPLGSGTSVARQFVTGLGDVNGDGFADVAVGEGAASFQWTIYMGSAAGAVTPGQALGSCADFLDEEGDGVVEGCSAGRAGDVNGDGFADGVMCSRTAKTATVYLGSALGSFTAQNIPMPTGETAFGRSCIGAGDTNGDGYSDVIVSTATNGVYLFLGGASGIQTPFSAAVAGGTGTGDRTTTIAPAGDVNGDNYADILVGVPGESRTIVLLGGSGGTLTVDKNISLVPIANGYGNSVATLGDSNNDGFDDIAIAATVCGSLTINAYAGSGAGVDNASPLRQWLPPAGTTCYGILAR